MSAGKVWPCPASNECNAVRLVRCRYFEPLESTCCCSPLLSCSSANSRNVASEIGSPKSNNVVKLNHQPLGARVKFHGCQANSGYSLITNTLLDPPYGSNSPRPS